ncbi:MAG: ferritin-like domain-containing protein [Pseudomonadota bacterium]
MTSVAQAVKAVLETAEPRAKVMLARRVARDWRLGRLAHTFDVTLPDRPLRPAEPELLPPNRMPKRGKGSEHGRLALIHALAHIEFSAIDLAFDMAGRFGAQFPREFIDDWLGVGADEALHFALLDRRLRQLGSHYGALPAHNGLWDAASETAHDPIARLAVVPMVLEARGLDVTPATLERFERVGDTATARILSRIFNDEIRHVRMGTKWFESACEAANLPVVATWQAMVVKHFRGLIKPPFNDSARDSAGLSREYYQALAVD